MRQSLDAAYRSYVDLDFETFRSTFDALRDDVPCLAGTLDPDHAARLHLAYALDAFLDRDQDRMLRAVRGVLGADPDFTPSTDVARPGNGLYVAFDMASHRREPVTEPLPEGRWVIDGTPGASEVPVDRNALVHRVDVDPMTTWYLDAPELPVGLAPVVAPAPAAASSRRSWTLLGAGLGVGVVSVASLSTAAVLKDRYHDDEDPPADPQQVRTWNHVTGVSGWVLAVGAAGLGAGAVATWEW